MIDKVPSTQMTHEVFNLIDGDGITHTRIDARSFIERTPTIDANQLCIHVEKRPTRITGVDGSIDLDAIGVFEHPFFRILIAMRATHQTESYGGGKVGGQHERISHCDREIAYLNFVAVGEFCKRERFVWFLGKKFDECHITNFIEPD